jgi:hypothetical protein
MSTKNLLGEVKSDPSDRLTIFPQSLCRLSAKCGSLDVSQPCGPPRPVTGIALPFYNPLTHFVVDGVKKPLLNTREMIPAFLRCENLTAVLKYVKLCCLVERIDVSEKSAVSILWAAGSFKTLLRYYRITWSHVKDGVIEIILYLSPSVKVQMICSLDNDTRLST